MSLFKKNSRFSSLVEDEPKKEKREKNIETRPNNNEHSFKRNKDDGRGNYGSFKDDKTRREDARLKEEKIKEKKLKESLSLESFPPLTPIIPINITSSTKNHTSFSEKLQTVLIKSSSSPSVEEDTDYKNLMRGWTLIKSDINKNIVIQSKDNSSLELEKTDNEIAFEVFDTLVEVHEKSRDEYIEMWGYEEWEKMFTFPNYDYEYFVKLDELYNEEMENQISDDDEEEYYDYLTDYEKYNNY